MATPFQNLNGLRVLLLEDEAYLARQVARRLSAEGVESDCVGTLAEAREVLEAGSFDAACFDVNLPDGRSLDLLAEPEFPRQLPVVIMTSDGQLPVAVEAMRQGAVDFLCKPFELDEVPLALSRAVERRQSQRRNEHRRAESQRDAGGLFYGRRLAMIQAQIERILAAEQRLDGRLPPVLIEGETGVGKTAIARLIHQQGVRANREIVAVNCAALPEALAESELFGHEKGAFTDAREARIGLFEAANGSTLFLDEIASLPLPIQAKLLTVLEDGAIRRVSGKRAIPVDVRILAASLKDLRALVAAGTFREDLMHRLDLLRLRVPPLRETPEDLPLLAEHLLSQLARRYGLSEARLSPTAKSRLLRYEWPGNVRELSHELERALILEDPTSLELSGIGSVVGDVPDEANGSSAEADWLRPDWELPEQGFSVEAATQRFIELALAQTGNNVSAAARRLGVPRDFVRYRLKKQTNSPE